MYKFRSMVTNAEQARVELESMNEMSGPVFKVKNDPRVTPLGRWLRRTSLDESPQLRNVLRGVMSLVGPRPLPLYETANFGDISQRRRMSVRPGLTCLWQVRGAIKLLILRTGCVLIWNTSIAGASGSTSRFSFAPCQSFSSVGAPSRTASSPRVFELEPLRDRLQ